MPIFRPSAVDLRPARVLVPRLSATVAVKLRLPSRRAAAAEGLVGGLVVPAVVTDLDGAVLAANAQMRADAGDVAGSGGRVEQLFAAILDDVDAPALYRLGRTARERGLAVMAVLTANGHEPRHLVARAVAEDRLIWSLDGRAALADMIADPEATPFETAPFAHVRLEGTRVATTNAAFNRFFGPASLDNIVATTRASGGAGDRIVLRGANGHVGSYRCFSFALDHPPRTDILLFPIRGDTAARVGSTGVLERVPVPLAQFELDGTLLWCNSRARDVLGDHAVPGTALVEMIEPMGRSVEHILGDAVRGDLDGPPVGDMMRLRDAETFLQVALTRVRIYERETLLGVISDASQLRELEDQFAQSQKMEAVGKLAGGVAHDFNNVLTAIVGHCDLLLLRKDPSHPDYADLMQIAQNANRAAALVRQLLAFSRKQTLKPETLSLRDVVSETHYLLDRLVGDAIRLSLNFGPDLWPVRADHQQLEQVLMNLVVNARDAMQGAGKVIISARNQRIAPGAGVTVLGQSMGEYVEIEVRDTGPGIEPSVIEKVFEPFFTTKEKGEGTGLGLSTVYGIVKQSGGQVFATNAPDGGAAFVVRLPRAVAEATQPAPEVLVRPAADLTGTGAVLLVEDEVAVRAFAKRALELRGYQVSAAETAEEGMELLADPEFKADVIVSDVVMPGMDGPTFAAQARKLRPGVRLILVSGYAEESFRKNLTESDFLFLPKPFSLNELTAAVKEALGGSPELA